MTTASEVRVPPSGPFEDLPPSGSVPPLTKTLWVDAGTAVLPADADGSIQKPYATLTDALAAGLATTNNVTLLVVAGDYSTEATLALSSNLKVQIQGVQVPGLGTGFLGSNPLMPAMSSTLGGEIGSLVLQNLDFTANLELAGTVQFIDCVNIPLLANGADFASFDIRGGSITFLQGSSGSVNGAVFGPAAVSVQLNGTRLNVANCDLQLGQVSVDFLDAAGAVFYDLQTEALSSGVPFAVVNGTAARMALPVQSIVGVTTQDQVDSIVAAGVALGLWTDNR